MYVPLSKILGARAPATPRIDASDRAYGPRLVTFSDKFSVKFAEGVGKGFVLRSTKDNNKVIQSRPLAVKNNI